MAHTQLYLVLLVETHLLFSLLFHKLKLFLFFRLFNNGIGIHLLQSDDVPSKKSTINPKDNHISFQCTDMKLVMQKLEEMNIEYVTAAVEEGGITVDQLFFHDPDGYMVEICNCQNLPVLPLSSCPLKLPKTNKRSHGTSTFSGRFSPIHHLLTCLLPSAKNECRCGISICRELLLLCKIL